MKQHKITWYLCYAVAVLFFTACDKVDDNGDLGGMWQLTNWTKKAQPDKPYKTSADRIYYAFRLNYVRTQCMSEDAYYISEFHVTSDSLCVDRVYAAPNDSVVSVDALLQYGVDSSGRFHIDRLTGNSMVLSNEENVLTFRKY